MPIGRGYIEANVFLGISYLIVKASKWQVSLAEPLFPFKCGKSQNTRLFQMLGRGPWIYFKSWQKIFSLAVYWMRPPQTSISNSEKKLSFQNLI